MKTINLLVAILCLTFIVTACGRKMNFINSSIVPGATGQVDVKKDRNSNYVINVNVLNLAEPKRLSPPKEVYVVWMEASNESAKKLGQITPSSGLLSKALRATMSATVITEPKRVFITAEDNIDVSYPGGQTVLTTQ
ncbi:hypothetical protein [Fibrivirga algicola]|uniref:Uncharacterized protein n=1 Tax=Fibrivirga algicola TaxID=2950420 RepID=A0ABX0QDL2_9BACT|nr:hypothetical protein [Fibrivirga algicola]ARK13468.1 hypothetical protein A6C57_01425 [Fibrella sp. ES10-3-2-2]NID08808.1 hypothetical protein [Fibrivirga algicola]